MRPAPAFEPHLSTTSPTRLLAWRPWVLEAPRCWPTRRRQDSIESLALRDIRVYSQALGASLSAWRDTQMNRGEDAVLELPNGRWAVLEFKLGEGQVDAAARDSEGVLGIQEVSLGNVELQMDG